MQENLRRLFQPQSSVDEFSQWCYQSLRSLNSASTIDSKSLPPCCLLKEQPRPRAFPIFKGINVSTIMSPIVTVAHNCHGKTKNLTAKTKYLTAKPKTSWQKQKPLGKTKNLTAKTKYFTTKPKTSRQNQRPRGKTKYFTAKAKYLTANANTTAKPKLFCFCCEVFGFA